MARGKGEGSVFQRADGYWVGAIEVGRYANGQRRKARVVRRYKADVVAALAELRNQTRDGIVPDRTTTAATFFPWWVENVKASEVSSGTLRQYRQQVGSVVRIIGHHKLHKLNRAHIQHLLATLEREGISPVVRQQILTAVVRQALNYAVDGDLIARNPAASVKGPKIAYRAKTDDTPEIDEVKRILTAAEGDGLYPLAWLALHYGLRQGELLRLRWNDVDLDAETIVVRESKTDAGGRTLPMLPDLVTIMKAHRAAQAAERLASLLWGDAALVFTGTYYGQPGHRLTAEQCRLWWHDLLMKAGVSDRRFHSSRHAAATMLLEKDVPMAVISKVLGHANINITNSIYTRKRNDLVRRELLKASNSG